MYTHQSYMYRYTHMSIFSSFPWSLCIVAERERWRRVLVFFFLLLLCYGKAKKSFALRFCIVVIIVVATTMCMCVYIFSLFFFISIAALMVCTGMLFSFFLSIRLTRSLSLLLLPFYSVTIHFTRIFCLDVCHMYFLWRRSK